MEPFNQNNKIGRKIMSFIKGYNHEKYWRRRSIVIDPTNKVNTLIKLYYLYYIKKIDAKNLCSFGTNINAGAFFVTPSVYHTVLMGLLPTGCSNWKGMYYISSSNYSWW